MRRLLGACLLLAPLTADASRPPAPQSFSNGLDMHEGPTTPINGVVMLRTPPPNRIFIPGATFSMGSGMIEVEAYKRLCEADPHGVLCRGGTDDVITKLIVLSMPPHDVTVSPFLLDRTEVTVEQYGRCVANGACSAPGYPPNDARFDKPDLPVTHVTWEDAHQYCKWVHGRLPTEAEWELAARGEAKRVFPWGRIYNPHLCNHGSFARDSSDGSDGFLGLAPVGSYKDGATPLGVLDLAGNVAEWVEDRFDADPGTQLGYSQKAQTNPVFTKGPLNIIRGGSYDTGSFMTVTTSRVFVQGTVRRNDVGFRCAYEAEGFTRAPMVAEPPPKRPSP